jgi:hypothetical protein
MGHKLGDKVRHAHGVEGLIVAIRENNEYGIEWTSPEGDVKTSIVSEEDIEGHNA